MIWSLSVEHFCMIRFNYRRSESDMRPKYERSLAFWERRENYAIKYFVIRFHANRLLSWIEHKFCRLSMQPRPMSLSTSQFIQRKKSQLAEFGLVHALLPRGGQRGSSINLLLQLLRKSRQIQLHTALGPLGSHLLQFSFDCNLQFGGTLKNANNSSSSLFLLCDGQLDYFHQIYLHFNDSQHGGIFLTNYGEGAY